MARRGHLTMDATSTIRVKRLGQPATELDYERERKNFAGDCVFFLQRHFVDCMLSGHEFESSGRDYLKNVRIVDAAYESARTHNSVRVSAGAADTEESLRANGLSDGKTN